MEKVLGTEQAPSKSLLTEAMRAQGDRGRPLEWDSEGSGETKSNWESWQRLGTRNTMAMAGSSTRSLLGGNKNKVGQEAAVSKRRALKQQQKSRFDKQ